MASNELDVLPKKLQDLHCYSPTLDPGISMICTFAINLDSDAIVTVWSKLYTSGTFDKANATQSQIATIYLVHALLSCVCIGNCSKVPHKLNLQRKPESFKNPRQFYANEMNSAFRQSTTGHCKASLQSSLPTTHRKTVRLIPFLFLTAKSNSSPIQMPSEALHVLQSRCQYK
eukprot:5951531-Amphidinium_carterae.1